MEIVILLVIVAIYAMCIILALAHLLDEESLDLSTHRSFHLDDCEAPLEELCSY